MLSSDGKPRMVDFLLLEYFPTSLESFLKDMSGPIDWRTFKTLALCILEALLHLQRHNVLHLDVKPANVLVDTGTGTSESVLRAVLCDFGTARYFDHIKGLRMG